MTPKSMTIRLLAVGLALALLAAVPSAVLANEDGQEGSDHEGNASDHGKQWKDESDNDAINGNGIDNKAREEGYNKRLFGHFNLTDGVADGKFISFGLNISSGNVTDYALKNVKNASGAITFFDSIRVLDFEPSGVSVRGSIMLVSNESVQAIIHDNPTGMFHVVSNETNTTISFLLAPGMSALPLSHDVDLGYEGNEREQEREHNDTGMEDLEDDMEEHMADNLSLAVAIVGNGAYGVIATDSGNITIDSSNNGTYVNVTISYNHVMFRAKPVFSHHQMNDDAILKAISEGRVAGEISLVLRDGVTSYDTMEYRDQFRIRLLTAQRDRIQLQVEDQEHLGKVVIVNVDDGTFDSHKGELSLELDGVPIRSTTNPLDVLYASGSQSSDAIYCVIESNGVSQFLIYVPSFSVHQLSVSSLGAIDSLQSVMGVMAIVGALALVGAAGFFMLRRKR